MDTEKETSERESGKETEGFGSGEAKETVEKEASSTRGTSRDRDSTSHSMETEREKADFSSDVDASSFEGSTGETVKEKSKFDFTDYVDESPEDFDARLRSSWADMGEDERERANKMYGKKLSDQYKAASKRVQEATLAGKEPEQKDLDTLKKLEDSRKAYASESFREIASDIAEAGGAFGLTALGDKNPLKKIVDSWRNVTDPERAKAPWAEIPKKERKPAEETTESTETPTPPKDLDYSGLTETEFPKDGDVYWKSKETTPSSTEAPTAEAPKEEVKEPTVEEAVSNVESTEITPEDVESIINEVLGDEEEERPFIRDRRDQVRDTINNALDRIKDSFQEDGFVEGLEELYKEATSIRERLRDAVGGEDRDALDAYYRIANTIFPGFEKFANGLTIAAVLMERLFGLKPIEGVTIHYDGRDKNTYSSKEFKTPIDLSTKRGVGKYSTENTQSDWNRGLKSQYSDEQVKGFIRTMVRGQPHVRNLANKFRK